MPEPKKVDHYLEAGSFKHVVSFGRPGEGFEWLKITLPERLRFQPDVHDASTESLTAYCSDVRKCLKAYIDNDYQLKSKFLSLAPDSIFLPNHFRPPFGPGIANTNILGIILMELLRSYHDLSNLSYLEEMHAQKQKYEEFVRATGFPTQRPSTQGEEFKVQIYDKKVVEAGQAFLFKPKVVTVKPQVTVAYMSKEVVEILRKTHIERGVPPVEDPTRSVFSPTDNSYMSFRKTDDADARKTVELYRAYNDRFVAKNPTDATKREILINYKAAHPAPFELPKIFMSNAATKEEVEKWIAEAAEAFRDVSTIEEIKQKMTFNGLSQAAFIETLSPDRRR